VSSVALRVHGWRQGRRGLYVLGVIAWGCWMGLDCCVRCACAGLLSRWQWGPVAGSGGCVGLGAVGAH
jgi:hypothetical protein